MYEYQYNPFFKTLRDVVAEDLAQLRSVSEGWFVDYKRTALDTRELGKHISAFANQRGGWLIFGIEEAQDGSRTAAFFPGIPEAEVIAAGGRRHLPWVHGEAGARKQPAVRCADLSLVARRSRSPRHSRQHLVAGGIPGQRLALQALQRFSGGTAGAGSHGC